MPNGPVDWSPERIEAVRAAPDWETLRELTAGTVLSDMPDEVAEAGREAAGRLLREDGAVVGLPDWMLARPPGASRRAIEREFGGSRDLAGAAEGLVREGKITYGQETPEEITKQIEASPLSDRWAVQGANLPFVHASGRQATRLNCYEFVHLAAGLSAPDGAREGAGNTIEDVAVPGTVEEWDGESEIPEGKVVIGISDDYGEGPDKTYHFAISMGGGRVANNHGSGPMIEDLDEVFGGLKGRYIYDRILIADYRYIAGEPEPPAPRVGPPPATVGGTSRIRNDTGGPLSVASGGAPVGGALAPGETSPALAGEGTTTVEVAAEPEAAETARAIELLMRPGLHTVTPVRRGADGYEAAPSEPFRAPCCGEPIWPITAWGDPTSSEAAARGCAVGMLWWVVAAASILAAAIATFVLVGGDDTDDGPPAEAVAGTDTDTDTDDETEEVGGDSPEPIGAGSGECDEGIAVDDQSTTGLDPRVQLVGILPLVDAGTGNLWFVACFAQGWGDGPPTELFSFAFIFGVGPEGTTAQIIYERHDGEWFVAGERASGPFQPVFVLTAGGNVLFFTGLSVPEQFSGLIRYQMASTPTADDEVTRVDGEEVVDDALVEVGRLADLVDSVAVDTATFFGFDADGLTGDEAD